MKVALKWFSRYFVAIFLVWIAASGLYFSWHDSMTTDEGVHTASAYNALTKHDALFDPEHPFLYKDLTALPLLFIHTNLPNDDAKLWAAATPTFYDSWQEARRWSDEWFYGSGNNADLMIFLARLPGVIVMILLGWLMYRYNTAWFGERTGRWALFFTAFCPTLLANGHLTDTDVPVALTILVCFWALWRYYEEQTLKQAAWLGLGLAVALTTKYSAVALIPITVIWFGYSGIKKKVAFSKLLGHLLLMALIIWLFIWTLYGWHSPLVPYGEPLSAPLGLIKDRLAAHHLTLKEIGTDVRWFLPSPYIKGMILTFGSSIFGRGMFFLGKQYGSGVWYYFPIVLFLKTQVIALLILFTGVAMYFRKVISVKHWQPLSWLLGGSALIVTFFSLTSKLDLGIRYISPLFPLLCIALAIFATYMEENFHWKYFVPVVAVLYVVPVLLQFNDLLAFSNIFTWPQKNTYEYFNDSNLDWGQQTRAAAQVVKDRYHNQPVAANYQWTGRGLQYYGVDTISLNAANPPKNTVILINATELEWPEYSYFRTVTPDYQMGKETFFYVLK